MGIGASAEIRRPSSVNSDLARPSNWPVKPPVTNTIALAAAPASRCPALPRPFDWRNMHGPAHRSKARWPEIHLTEFPRSGIHETHATIRAPAALVTRQLPPARMAKQVDARDLKSLDRKVMPVRSRLRAPRKSNTCTLPIFDLSPRRIAEAPPRLPRLKSFALIPLDVGMPRRVAAVSTATPPILSSATIWSPCPTQGDWT
jgi:hypothetical protein